MQFIFVVTFVILACSVVDAKPTKGMEYICALYPDDGPCRARVPQFYFNMTTKTCEEFIYGGCEGNANIFREEDECLKKCKGPKVPSICSVPYVDEKCRYTSYKPQKRYYYNDASNECILIDPNRCPKTQNLFWNKKYCESRCKTKEKRTMKAQLGKRHKVDTLPYE
uniref:Putative salivary kunitz domain protein n=1 Tax=Ixodes ricinus TaxID=34613 RepID=A0A0K8R9F8_IXORI